ncbi:hypothetical protein [Prescottella subtropica]|uniref:hypothetical protein n=1 Tax=Prescottella subtropica TaxID=2545757 RepID=UPI0010F9BD0B|nr:hypothetical protein [Prescottella subtropica]
MNRKTLAATVIAATLAIGLTACGSDDAPAASPTVTVPTTTAPASPYDSDDFISKRQRFYVQQIIDTVEQRGGTPDQVLAALVAAKAESNWIAGNGNKLDIYGWEHRLRYGASDSAEATPAATNNFMDVAATVTVDDNDPVAYALAVQRADPRGYDEKEHFRYKKGATAAGEYAAALPDARAAYEELRGAQ